jgi:hypothetical protein
LNHARKSRPKKGKTIGKNMGKSALAYMQVPGPIFRNFSVVLQSLLFGALISCHSPAESPLFRKISAVHSAITFTNTIEETDSLNILNYEYLYNGGGVGVGDVNNDGLQDLFFTGNTVSSRLYLNRGSFKFEDVTEQSGITTHAWCTGVAMVDINQDGWLDIYISTAGPQSNEPSRNLLFVNKGVNEKGQPVFEERASTVGLADTSFCVQSAFLDYDLDGDLDVYLLTNFIEPYNRNTPFGQHHDGTGNSVDKLFRNEGLKNGMPYYRDVSAEAGILSDGWGLGIIVNDVNRDGYPDIYVANDFIANDHLYINQGNGTFTNAIGSYLRHQEHDGMGVDMADINNDGLNDLIALDMMPEDNIRQKAMFSNNPYDRFQLNLRKGYQPQYVRNVLQLNNGNNSYSDIGYLANVYATDWSWSALFADVDNDSYRDLFITNGFRKDITDLDFVSYSNEANRFGTSTEKLKKAREALERLEGVRKPNCLFRNEHDLTFSNQTLRWGLTESAYSTGAVYADLDNDNDLDLVVNNINEEAHVYENTLVKEGNEMHALRIQLIGQRGNLQGIGAKLWVYAGGETLYAEHQLQRGYQSSTDPIEHFGVGHLSVIDSIRVVWPRGATQLRKRQPAGAPITLYEDSAIVVKQPVIKEKPYRPLFAERHSGYHIIHKSSEDDFVDYKQGQPLLLRKYSQDGPGIAVGDINRDGREDFIVGGPAHHAAKIFLQGADGTFTTDSLPSKSSEDMGLLLFDADGDGDQDLYCVSGSAEFGLRADQYQDRFYLNDGTGRFIPMPDALPSILSSGSCVTAADYDKDGDLDVFIGGRISPTQFPVAPRSFILQNDGHAHFTDITGRIAHDLVSPGMVTSALWTDFDNDGWIDLAIAGEWMPVTFYRNVGGKSFEKSFSSEVGWWNSISGGDADNDGDIDYVVGNLGLNSLFKASVTEPVALYAKDFDENGSIDPIVTRYIQGKEHPTHYRESMTEQMALFRRRLPNYATYGSMSFRDLLSTEELKDALLFKATCLTSSLLVNLGEGKFDVRPLPVAAQMAPLYGSAFADINADGNLDIIGVGNSYAAETAAGYYDAGIGVCLLGDGKGYFKTVDARRSGLFAARDAKGIALLQQVGGNTLWVVTNNKDSLQVFEQLSKGSQVINMHADDVRAELVFTSGERQLREGYYGNGYLSQGGRSFILSTDVRACIIENREGKKRHVRINAARGEWNRR